MKNKNLWTILLAGLALRIMLSFFGTLQLDFGTFVAWSQRLVDVDFQNFYESWSDYFPGYLYVLYLLGLIDKLSIVPQTLLYKAPAIISDVLTAYIIYQIVLKAKGKRLAQLSTVIYLFNPAVLANSTLWGQADSLVALFSLSAVWIATVNPLLSAPLLAIGVLIKPQALVAAPVIFFILLKNKTKPIKTIIYFITAFAIFIAGFIPFSQGPLFQFISQRVSITINQYPYTSVNAFNFWGFSGFWIKEATGLSITQALGYVISIGISLFAAIKIFNRKYFQYPLLAVAFAASFMFFTRMHERHLFPVFAPLSIAAALYPALLIPYIGLSIVYSANLYYAHYWISNDFATPFPEIITKLFIMLNIQLFLLLVVLTIKKRYHTKLTSFIKHIKHFSLPVPTKASSIPEPSSSLTKKILLAILIFGIATHFIALNKPADHYFDEVYHAFTAQEILKGNPQAWEWWNDPPEGFAYEWTHPPLAKEGMVLGMLVFGDNPFGWRAPQAILGVLNILLVYLIAQALFKSKSVGLLSAFVYSAEGLPLVMSRIGMNDTYFLFFSLLSLYLFIKNKIPLSSLALGLAAASKWSAVWMVPLIIIAHILLKKKLKPSYIFFIIIPPLVYIASYIPMFITGHNWNIFIGVQKQMWWYHTGLDATHPYTSSWWSWPLLSRPIWLYTSGELAGKISNIYAMGNPLLFWSGLAAIITSAIFALLGKVKERMPLLLIVFSYFIFFIPWALSPRIMFLYHYLPSIPFFAIALGYVLTKTDKKFTIIFLVLSLITFLYFFPHYTGLPVSKSLDDSYYWFNSWR